jgi:NADH-ubiquinone oxidoreductase chain 6
MMPFVDSILFRNLVYRYRHYQHLYKPGVRQHITPSYKKIFLPPVGGEEDSIFASRSNNFTLCSKILFTRAQCMTSITIVDAETTAYFVLITNIIKMSNFLLDFLSLGAILSGILVITSKNPVISVLFLISVFVNVAGYLVLLGIGFLGISYIIVYVGAIAILFLFVIMILNIQLAELSAVGSEYTQNLPLGGIVGSLFVFELISILPFSFKGLSTFNLSSAFNTFSETSLGAINWFNTLLVSGASTANDVHQVFDGAYATDSNFSNYLQIESIGQSLYTYGSIWLLLTSIILLLAMVGPIALSMKTTSVDHLYYTNRPPYIPPM